MSTARIDTRTLVPLPASTAPSTPSRATRDADRARARPVVQPLPVRAGVGGRMKAIQRDYADRGVGRVAVNSNDARAAIPRTRLTR